MHMGPLRPTPTILRELRGADEGGDLETVFGALLGGGKAGLGFGCLQLFFFHLCLGPRQGQVELSVFHFLVLSLERQHVRMIKGGTQPLHVNEDGAFPA